MTDKGYILAVDDTPASLRLLTDILKAEGYEVRSAISGELALHAATSQPPELILLDVSMPGMSGFEVCQRLKAQTQTRDVPVIFVSAMSETFEKAEGLRTRRGGLRHQALPARRTAGTRAHPSGTAPPAPQPGRNGGRTHPVAQAKRSKAQSQPDRLHLGHRGHRRDARPLHRRTPAPRRPDRDSHCRANSACRNSKSKVSIWHAWCTMWARSRFRRKS